MNWCVARGRAGVGPAHQIAPSDQGWKRGTLTPCCVQLFLCGLRNFRRVPRADGFNYLEYPWLGASFTDDYTSWRCRWAQGMFAFQMRAQTHGMPEVIVICDWFMSFLWLQAYARTGAVRPAWVEDMRPETWEMMDGQWMTEFDTWEPRVTTIAHELMHTRAGGRAQDDLQPAVGIMFRTGWEYAKRNLMGLSDAESHAQMLKCGGLVAQGGRVNSSWTNVSDPAERDHLTCCLKKGSM